MEPGSSKFPDTRWSLVVNAGSGDSDSAREALGELARIYWYPLYAFARRSGNPAEDAEDLTQGFFAHLFSDGRVQRIGDASHGKLRSFLLASMKNHMLNQIRKESALKRGGGTAAIELDAVSAERRYALEYTTDTETPETLFERRWALEILDRTFTRLRTEYEKAGKLDRYEALKDTLSRGKSNPSFKEIGQHLDIDEGAARVAAHRLRRQFRALLREEVADTVELDTEVDGELKYLQQILAR